VVVSPEALGPIRFGPFAEEGGVMASYSRQSDCCVERQQGHLHFLLATCMRVTVLCGCLPLDPG
jgi:hypothetical protein